ncbi:putative UPF0481 protein At3g02645 [Tripterygium wilfordii]|uniref:putative UPF0481 protein At3g02645 n=1 Tax=Tripterygium wilfordii TaxID=458696 RepID=UPI0018F82BAA|nr:putative UPF0481 protein At3g02645 [Tripterygium wilfordii]
MSSTQFNMSNLDFDEHRWLINIRRTVEEEVEDEREIPVSIFNVPKSLMSSDPDSYTPQVVALGPYHYFRPNLYEMERYKLAATKMTKKQLQSEKFKQLVDQLVNLELRIRASYHKFLDFSHETLAWMMVVDGSFLLEILHVYAAKEGKVVLTRTPSKLSHLVGKAGRASGYNAILRDMVMLENQIPLFVIRKLAEVQLSSLEMADDTLRPMLTGLCNDLSPFKITEEIPVINVSKSAHLLDYLYHTIVPIVEESLEITEIEELVEAMEDKEEAHANQTNLKKIIKEIRKIASKLNIKGPVHLIKRLLLSKPFKFVLKLPWRILSNLPGFSILKGLISQMFVFSQSKEAAKPEDGISDIEKPPLVEEIAVPSVSELSKSCVRFLPTNGNILTISFDVKTVTFYLPVVTLDMNTEVVLRNLVAYEASSESGPLVFTRYTELMNGIIDNEEDVKLLREKGIIVNRLKSDEEAANLWNGMSKSIKLTKVPFLDKTIEDVNKYYNSRWKVKAKRMMKLYVYGSWPILTLLAAIVLLVLMGLQAFCSVYTCGKVFKIENISEN